MGTLDSQATLSGAV